MKPRVFPTPSSETLALRSEWSADRAGERRHALKALAALSQTGETDPAGAADEVPPLPEDLRERWHETYGDARPAAPKPVGRGARAGGVAAWLGTLLEPRRLAWGGAFAIVVALGVLVFMQDPGLQESGATGVVTRGANHEPAATDQSRPILVIALDPGIEPLMRKLAEVYPSRKIERLRSLPGAAGAHPSGVDEVLILDPVARVLLVRKGDRTVKTFLLDFDPLTAPDSAILRIEDADESLGRPGTPDQ